MTGKDNRLFVEAVLWINRAGSPWRDLDPALGNWHATYTRLSLLALEQEGCVGARLCCVEWQPRFGISVHRQHGGTSPPARSGRPKKEGEQAIGRSRGGLSTKIHATVDALGNPLRWILTGGQAADITQAADLIADLPTTAVMAEKGYDADALIALIQQRGAKAVIPPRSNRIEQRDYDHHLYKDRNLVERFFARLKQFRRIATR